MNSVVGSALLVLLGIVLQDVNVALGLDCSPISIVGVGSSSECSDTAVSCSNGVVVSPRCYLDGNLLLMGGLCTT